MTPRRTPRDQRGSGSVPTLARGRVWTRLLALLLFAGLALLRTMSARESRGAGDAPSAAPSASRADRSAATGHDATRPPSGEVPTAPEPGTDRPTKVSRRGEESASSPGFRSRERLAEHYRKHGREFGDVSEDEYLRRAQALRDRPVDGEVLEVVRGDGVVTRFDRTTGAFLAFNRDRTIRTFFRPNDGEAYFRRQAAREDDR